MMICLNKSGGKNKTKKQEQRGEVECGTFHELYIYPLFLFLRKKTKFFLQLKVAESVQKHSFYTKYCIRLYNQELLFKYFQ